MMADTAWGARTPAVSTPGGGTGPVVLWASGGEPLVWGVGGVGSCACALGLVLHIAASSVATPSNETNLTALGNIALLWRRQGSHFTMPTPFIQAIGAARLVHRASQWEQLGLIGTVANNSAAQIPGSPTPPLLCSCPTAVIPDIRCSHSVRPARRADDSLPPQSTLQAAREADATQLPEGQSFSEASFHRQNSSRPTSDSGGAQQPELPPTCHLSPTRASARRFHRDAPAPGHSSQTPTTRSSTRVLAVVVLVVWAALRTGGPA
jgi:hypothetical protein